MDKKCIKYFVILFAIIQIISIFYFINFMKAKNSIVTYFNSNDNNERLLFENDSDLYPEMSGARNLIWEQMNSYVFFKRTSAFYVIERSLLRIFYVTKSGKKKIALDFQIEIQLGNKLFPRINLLNATTKKHGSFGYYVWNSLNYNFNLLELLKIDSYDEILKTKYKFQVFVSNSDKIYEKTLYPIDVNLKYIRSRSGQQKEGSIVCSKCFWLKQEDYKDLFWWIELHRQAGYKKVIFCNNSIPNTKEFNDLFERNKDFVELSQLNFMPNFLKSNRHLSMKRHNYLNSFHELGSRFHIESDIFNMMITNECFLNNTHKYQHVAVLDNDEIVLPRTKTKLFTVKDNFNYISKLKFDSNPAKLFIVEGIELSCNNNSDDKLEKYFIDLNVNPVTFYFHMGFYLKDRQVNQIIEKLESYFLNITNSTNQIHKIIVNDSQPQSEYHNNYNFTFIIKNQDEINYALNVCKIYRNLIQNFENKHKSELGTFSDRFHRFFYIGGILSSFACGKSIHNTDVSFDMNVHHPVSDINYPEQAEISHINYNFGHLGHFRYVNEFHKSNYKEISITELILDLNYLNCYYKPMVEKSSKIRLF
jgi:hypothetical protein